MRLYDEDVWMSHLSSEVERSKRYGFPFSIVALKVVGANRVTSALLQSLLEVSYRSVDIVCKRRDGTILLLLVHTEAEGAANWVSRLVAEAVQNRNLPILSAMVVYEDGMSKDALLNRLLQKVAE